jgi:hypothetical protein
LNNLKTSSSLTLASAFSCSIDFDIKTLLPASL